MLANTKQVRAVLKSFNISANYTEKTTKEKSSTRVVMAVVFMQQELFNAVKQKFADLGYNNKVYYTQDMYLRVKTFIA